MDWKKYAACMEEIKHRTKILDEALNPYRNGHHLSVANCELASLQMRKIYELIAFASISANKERYRTVRTSYEKDWNLAKIVGFISNINPDFLPLAIYEVDSGDEDVRFEVKEKDTPKLSKGELVGRHGKLGGILHAQNPYRKPPDYEAWFKKLVEWRDEAVALLSNHRVTIDDKTWFRVVMQTQDKGEVQVATMSLVGEIKDWRKRERKS